jgi:hypothetical protein
MHGVNMIVFNNITSHNNDIGQDNDIGYNSVAPSGLGGFRP